MLRFEELAGSQELIDGFKESENFADLYVTGIVDRGCRWRRHA